MRPPCEVLGSAPAVRGNAAAVMLQKALEDGMRPPGGSVDGLQQDAVLERRVLLTTRQAVRTVGAVVGIVAGPGVRQVQYHVANVEGRLRGLTVDKVGDRFGRGAFHPLPSHQCHLFRAQILLLHCKKMLELTKQMSLLAPPLVLVYELLIYRYYAFICQAAALAAHRDHASDLQCYLAIMHKLSGHLRGCASIYPYM